MKKITITVKDNYDTALLLTGINILLRNQQETFKRLNECPPKVIEKEIEKSIEEYDRMMTLEAQLIILLKGDDK